ncbi:DUF881 domain-containing protein, partial [Actinoplanes sp. NPDC026623]|uniref:DUF881 domain-containing protein n=1 Tax=Actinoplanes sp. NPDC026623 TaxID=3155610 RepID=UPI0033DA713C
AGPAAADPPASSPPAEPAVGDAGEPAGAWPAVTGDDEATTLLTPPDTAAAPASAGTPPAGGVDEPSPRRSPDDGETVRLQPPFFAPRTSTLPRTPPAATAPDAWFAEPQRAERAAAPQAPADESPVAGGTDSGERDEPGAPLGIAGEDAPAESPVPVTAGASGPAPTGEPAREREKERKITSAGALIWVLLALLGYTLVVQLRSNDADAGLATARQEDLVGILSDLEARDQRLQQEINNLEESQRQLTSGVAGRQAALTEAGKRADELGLLSGTLAAHGPGLHIQIDPRGQPVKASQILNAVQELRGAGGEVMEIVGANGVAVRIVASSYFVDAAGGDVIVDGKQLSGPYTLRVIGVPSTMQTALQIPGGVVASVSQAGGNVTMEQRSTVEVTAVRQPTSLQYARPVK